MSRCRWLGRIVLLALVAKGCSVVSDFDHLDDGASDAAGGRGGATGEGGEAGSSGGAAGSGAVAGFGGAAGAGASGGGGGDDGGTCKTSLATCGQSAECCTPLQCDNTSAGLVCCGLTGEPCVTFGGEDCCDFRECRRDDNGAFCSPGAVCHCADS